MTRSTVPIIIARVAGFFAIVVAMLPLSYAWRMYDEARLLDADGIITKASVVAVEERKQYDGAMRTMAIVEFTDESGAQHEFETLGAPEPGREVQVIYLPDYPGEALVYDGDLYRRPTVVAILAGIPLAFGLFLLWVAPIFIRRSMQQGRTGE